MAFPRAPLKRFNEIHDKTPGVGSYNLYKENAGKDKTGSLARINETLKSCRDKALMAAEKGVLPKHIEEIHAKLAKAEERVVDLEILKISWDKQRELTEKEKGELRQKLIKLENVQEKFDRAEGQKLELEKQIKSLLKEIEKLEQRTHELQLQVKKVEEMKDNLEKEKSQLTSELESLKKMYSENQDIVEKQKDELGLLKKDVCDAHKELESIKEECELLKATQEKKSQEFENEKRTLTSQVEYFNTKCAEWEDKHTKISEASAKEIGALLEANVQKVCEIEEKKRVLENLEMKHGNDLEQIKEQEEQLKGRISQLEENQLRLEKESANLSKDLSSCEEEKRQLENENSTLSKRLAQAQEETENLSQHLVDVQNKLLHSMNEIDTLKQEKERDSCLQEEMQVLISQVETLNLKYDDSELKLKTTSEKYSLEIEALQEASAEKILELTSKLEQALEDVEELTQHVVFTQDKLQASTKEAETMKQKQLKEAEEFECEKQFLTSQVQSLIMRCEECEERLKKTTESHAMDLELFKNKSSEKVSELQERNRNLEEKMSQVEKNRKEVLSQEQQLKEKLLALEKARGEQESEFASLVQDLKGQLLSHGEKNQTLEIENEDLVQKLEHALERVETIEAENEEALRNAEASYSKEWNERLSVLETAQKQQESESAILLQDLTGKLLSHEEKNKALEKLNDDLVQKLELALARVETIEAESEEALRKAKASYSEELVKLESDTHDFRSKQEAVWEEKQSAWEDEKNKLESELNLAKDEIRLLEKETNHFHTKCEEIGSANENLTQYLTQMEKDMESHREESDREIEGLNTIIAEMSEKIEQFECERAELMNALDEDWKEKYDALVKKMEPFKEVLDGFELERQLLQDRDKFTSEQLEKLTQECIKNMGHQNHKQRIKYLDKVKQENLNLFKTVQELQEHNRRQEATIKKLKEKTTDKTETSKKPWQRTPLKEGNRL